MLAIFVNIVITTGSLFIITNLRSTLKKSELPIVFTFLLGGRFFFLEF